MKRRPRKMTLKDRKGPKRIPKTKTQNIVQNTVPKVIHATIEALKLAE